VFLHGLIYQFYSFFHDTPIFIPHRIFCLHFISSDDFYPFSFFPSSCFVFIPFSYPVFLSSPFSYPPSPQ
jgi:hypothetical protein